jgi:alanine-synthesizing transaminase
MFSKRLRWDAATNPISELVARKRAAGERILDLTESNPTHAGLRYEQVVFDDPRMMSYDPDSLGMLSARECVAAEYGVDVSRVVLTTSTSEAYSWLFKLLCDPGDEVLVPQPSYPLFEYLAALENVSVRPYHLRYHEGWFVDIADIRVTERTRAIVVVNPNNPTGSYLKPAELEALVKLAREHDLAMISDEVFSDYELIPGGVRSLMGVEDAVTFCLNGLSKLIGLPQMKLGWIIVNDTASRERLELIADTYLSVGTAVQCGLPKLLAMKGGIQGQIMERVRENLALVKGARVVEGGWYAVLQVPRVRTEEEWVLGLLEQHNVLVQPGYFYDFESEAFLVLSLLTPPEVFQEGLSSLLLDIERGEFEHGSLGDVIADGILHTK